MTYSLNSLYRVAGVSRQAVHQSRKRQQHFDSELRELVCRADAIRAVHPGCGVEKLYTLLKPQTMGRDKFCQLFMELGYRVRKIKNYTKTTTPGWVKYPNYIQGMQVIRPHQVLQSDITYVEVGGRFYYLVFLVDVYTREILGYHVGDTLRAECTLAALRMALKKIPKGCLAGMIHHSDRGSQYGSHAYVQQLKRHGMTISMGEAAQDNAYVERVNGTIKNEYLKHWVIADFKTLQQKTRQAVSHYNQSRVHQAFGNLYSPAAFKQEWLSSDRCERPKEIIYAEGNYEVKAASHGRGFELQKEPQGHSCPIGF